MSNEFFEPSDEIKRVAEEINLLRRDIQTASSTLGRIERRLKASFPNFPSKKKQSIKNKETGKMRSSMTSQELQTIFDDLVSSTQSGGDTSFAQSINKYSDEDIIAIAVEVGVGSSRRLSRSKAIDSIRKRVQEALQLQFEMKRPHHPIQQLGSSNEIVPPLVEQQEVNNKE